MKKLILALFLLISICVSSNAQVESTPTEQDQQYSETLKKMFEVSGTEATYQGAIKQMFTLFKQQYSNVETDVWSELEQEFSKTSLDDLTEMLVPIYSKYLSADDLSELIQFYDTPVGKKFAESSPLIMQESMQVGQEWGMKIGQEFEKKMRDRGY